MRWKTSWIACCVVMCTQLSSAQEWERLSLFAPSDSLYDAAALPSGRIVAVGLHGTIVLSDDLCQSWEIVYSGTAKHLRRVDFVDDSLGWAVGSSGTILHSADRGESWVEQPCSTSKALRGVDFVDALHGWVVGEQGCNFRTADGGATWTGYGGSINNYDDLLGVAFRDTLHGCAVGGYSYQDPPNLRYTLDGGEIWHNASYNRDGWLADVEFLDDSTAIAVGRHNMILRSTDGGVSWDSVAGAYHYFFPPLRDVEFLGSLGVAVSDSGMLLNTMDGGITWDTLSETGIGHGLAIATAETYVSVGRNADVTVNAGETWTPSREIPYGNVIDIDFLSDSLGWLLFDNNKLWKTTDGQTWSVQNLPGSRQFSSLDFVSELIGFAAFGRDSVARTTDGGETWETRDAHAGVLLYGVSFLNESRGWAFGDASGITGTHDGGETWSSEVAEAGGFLECFASYGSNHHWAAGAGGTLLRTINGGDHWDMLPQITFEDFYGLFLHDSLNGIAVGGNGSVYRTSDGGETWDGQHLPTTTLFAVDFANRFDGWIAGEHGVLFHTRDGGETWQQQDVQAAHHLRDIWVSSNRGWAAGYGGTILKADYDLGADDRSALIPTTISLSIFPNPFNSSATVRFELPREQRAEVIAYDVLGRMKEQLADRVFTAGAHTMNLNASGYASGTYFVQLRTTGKSETRKIQLIR